MEMLPTRRKSAAWLWWGLVIMLVAGFWYPAVGLLMIACMLAPVAVGMVRGRYWCGWMCPRGAFFDYIMARFSRRRPAPAWLRSMPFRVGMLAFLMTLMTVQIVQAWPSVSAIGMVFIRLLLITTLVGIVLAVRYAPRAWCGFCPMGTMANWVSHGKRPLQVNESCRNCHACGKACPMLLTPQQPGTAHADCVKCTHCIVRCPVKALRF